MTYNESTFRIENGGKIGNLFFTIGIVGIALSIGGWIVDSKQFYPSYLTSFVFWLSLGLGSLFFVMVNYLLGSKWHIVFRRIMEAMMMPLPIMLIFFIPILIGIQQLFPWSRLDYVAANPIVAKKAGYLNDSFFLIRAVIYFAIWTFLAVRLYIRSIRQDAGIPLTGIKRLAAPGTVLFAFSITFAAFDWMMSLDPMWYSTVYGLGYFTGSVMVAISSLVLFLFWFLRNNIMSGLVTEEHYHDLGKMLFVFMILWAYMAFSQFFLIWYANIPEETAWYHHRWEGSWKYITMAVVVGHFVVPFFTLLSRPAKRSPKVLVTMAIWLAVIHYIDLYWNIMPNFSHHGVHFSWQDLTTFAGIGGIFLWFFWQRLLTQPIIPINDPELGNSIKIVS